MKKLLLFSGSGVGNIIQSTPCIKALFSLDYEIDVVTWFIPETAEPSISILTAMDEVKTVFNLSTDLPFLELYKYDKICFLKISPPEAVISYFNIREYKSFVIIKYPENGSVNEVEMNMILAKELGYEGETPDTFCPYEEVDLPSFDFIFVTQGNPNPFWDIKKWPYFVQFSEELIKKGYSVSVVDNYDRLVYPSEVEDYTFDLTFLQKCGLIKKAKNVIGIDSGLSHASNALKTNTYVLFGPTSIIKCAPLGKNTKIITNQKDGRGCQRWQEYMNFWAEIKPEHEMKNITIEQVNKEVFK
ncbi:hypothetical protein DRN69_08280 [Candidatus Pacearchaeota archaeon]|nr:MAG: hypothetical protein DRN69_08280 [Candidatus Pacearchaeota archaeon]